MAKKRISQRTSLARGPQGSRRKNKIPLNESSTLTESATSFPIVGVGASAGGLEAFMEMFRTLPVDTGLAFVLVQHLSPQHISMLSTFVQKVTRMQVEEIKDGARVEPNHVYIIPPNALLEIYHGVLHLSPMPAPHAVTMPVNTFFQSLARDQGNLAIGVVLSGTGSDGAHGLREIKADGGITFVQKPESAKFDGMPHAAIAAAIPDHILPVDGISRELVHIARHPIVKKMIGVEDSAPTPAVEEILQKIFIIIRGVTKVDFAAYKYPTISRRIKRRMVLHRVDSLAHYLTYLQQKPTEVKALFEDLLINVTDFFRDSEVFESLKSNAFPTIMSGRAAGVPIRIWVPGCSTGEEVYSIAIALLEFLGESASKYPIQIYGTDICESAVHIARAGIYPESNSQTISAERLERFFRKEQGSYRVTKAVRDCCIFSIQDVTSQPPINRLDLLSCRNLLIYLSAKIQKKLMDTFFYALNPNGFLVLGTAESVGSAVDLFSVVEKKLKVYQKKTTATQPRLAPPEHAAFTASIFSTSQLTRSAEGLVSYDTPLVASPVKKVNPVVEAERQVLDQFAPAWVLVTPTLEIIQFRGVTAPYLEPARGPPTWSLMKMLHADFATDIRVLIHSCSEGGKAVRKNGIKIKSKTGTTVVDVEVSPVSGPNIETHFLVLFTERKLVEKDIESAKTKGKKFPEKEFDLILRENNLLKDELSVTQKSLQAIIEDQNATNEEMQSANEEVMSANEEFQSTNEELETAKEELQSTNEELTTLNDELSNRNAELDHISNDLLNLIGNASVSIVMVGPDLKIRRFTPMAEKLLNLIQTDVGRSLTNINFGFQIDNLEEKISDVMSHLSTIETEIRYRDGHWFSLRIRPYKTADNKIDGAVLVFINIDEAKNREKLTKAADAFSDGIIQTVRDPLVVLDEHLHVERVNQAFYDIFKVKPENTIGRLFYELGNRQWDIPELKNLLENVLPKKSEVRDFAVCHHFEEVGEKTIVVHARTLDIEGQKKLLMLITLHDLTAYETTKKNKQLEKEQD